MFFKRAKFVYWLGVISASCAFGGTHVVWQEAESMANTGCWSNDSQHVDIMGSAYLLATGVGKPVDDAVTTVRIPEGGAYRLWVRCRDWLVSHSPGRFSMLIDGKASPVTFGKADNDEWRWIDGGEFELEEGVAEVRLRDNTGWWGRCDAIVLAKGGFEPSNEKVELSAQRLKYAGVSPEIRDMGTYDVVVVGGGPAGMGAAIAAARNGIKVAFIQDRPVLGGNSSSEIEVPPMGYIGKPPDRRNITGITAELFPVQGWSNYADSAKMEEIVRAEENVSLFLNTRVTGVEMEGKSRIASVISINVHTGQRMRFSAPLFADTTGHGWVGYYAGAEYRMGQEGRSEFVESLAPVSAGKRTMGNSLYKAVFEDRAEAAPFECPEWTYQWKSSGDFEPLGEHRRIREIVRPGNFDEPSRGKGRNPGNDINGAISHAWWVEYGGMTNIIEDAEKIRDELFRISLGLWNYAKNHNPATKEKNLKRELVWLNYVPGVRESRRLVGDYVMSQKDYDERIIHDDTVAFTDWGPDVHHPEGYWVKGNDCIHVYQGRRTSIPYRTLYSKNIENLFMAGRCHSATHIALGGTRVMRPCCAMGQAVGTAAAIATKKKTTPRGIYEKHIGQLQDTLVEDGCRLMDKDGGMREPPVTIENDHVRYKISAEGKNLAFVDRSTGTDYLKKDTPSACATVRCKGSEYPATSVSLADGRLTVEFDKAKVKAVILVESREPYIYWAVESVSGANVESLVFLNVPLTLGGRPDEPFGSCAFSLNLKTRVNQLPALQTRLRASCYSKFGMEGAKVAIVAMPMKGMLSALKEVLTDADEMPHCTVGGPWAQETAFNHGSYLFNFGALTESNVDEWIAMAGKLGVTQIDNHGGSRFFRFGDFELDRAKWPEGWDTYRGIVKRLHEAGIGSIFHTYGFFIDKQSKYVTPVPDKRLDAFRTFTLAEDLDADGGEITVNESTKGMNTITGFFEHNSVILHIGDELVTFGAVSQESPWRFTNVQRGAFGTKASAHKKETKARHLKECFGLLVPDAESSLFEEIAKNHADIVNRCDFDGIYLDAIDGSSILRGADECWYWADKFIFDIQKHLKRPVGMEMSAMWHHFWQFRTRWQAWDYPQRGHKRFIDIHASSVNGGLLLPLHLGWWNFQHFNPPQVEPTYPDVIEYLGAKLIGWDAGISLTGAIDRSRLDGIPLFRRVVDVLRTCEELRGAKAFDESTRAKLREPGKEFSLFRDQGGKWRFRPAHYDSHKASCAEPWSLSWRAINPFGEQPAKFRLEALMSAASYDDAGNIVLADLSEPNQFTGPARGAAGVTAVLAKGAEGSAGVLSASNSGKVSQKGAWARLDRKFEPNLNLNGHQALGVRIEGDGKGEIIGIRLESPRHLAFGAVADRYIDIDFTGSRVFTLVETESERWSDYTWNDGKWLYNVYRETINFANIESLSIWYNNLAEGREVTCRIGPIKALPMVACTVRNPAIEVNGSKITLPVEMPSGSYLEFEGDDDCVLYGSKGEVIAEVRPDGGAPVLSEGKNEIRFSCGDSDGPPPRVKLTLISHGEGL